MRVLLNLAALLALANFAARADAQNTVVGPRGLEGYTVAVDKETGGPLYYRQADRWDSWYRPQAGANPRELPAAFMSVGANFGVEMNEKEYHATNSPTLDNVINGTQAPADASAAGADEPWYRRLPFAPPDLSPVSEGAQWLVVAALGIGIAFVVARRRGQSR